MPRPQPDVTALLPVGPGADPGRLRRAIDSLRLQTLPPAHLIVVANGLSTPEFDAVLAAVEAPGRMATRVLSLPRANLAAALNHGMRHCSTALVARMDADDESLPERLERQVAWLRAHPAVVAVGCAWEVVSRQGVPRAVIRPETDPALLSASLLLGNSLAHGSMLLRCDGRPPGGGYNEGLERAQDYDLWLRLRPRVGACPEVLYRYTEWTEPGVAASSEAQALAVARSMLEAWGGVPACVLDQRERLAAIIAAAMREDHGGDVMDRVRSLLAEGESREGLMALLWARDRFPPLRHRAIETCRRARVREVGGRIAAEGAKRMWLWGAGQHTRRLLEHADDLPVPLAGIADDAACGQLRFGFAVVRPRDVPPGEHLLISSDVHEERMWEASASLRARGVRVWRLYGGG